MYNGSLIEKNNYISNVISTLLVVHIAAGNCSPQSEELQDAQCCPAVEARVGDRCGILPD